MNARGMTPVVGVVLLFGFVLVGALAVFMGATVALEGMQQDIEADRVEQAMVEFNSQKYVASQFSDAPVGTDLDTSHYGITTREESGTITVESDDLPEDISLTIGTVEWEGEDGTKIASEGGAVFRETGAETRVVSAPPVEYDPVTNTLNLKVMNTVGDDDLGSGAVRLSNTNTTPYASGTITESDHVTVTVESEYCVGWERYFVKQSGESAIQESCGEDDTVVAQLGYLDFSDSFSSGIGHHPDGDVDDFNQSAHGPTFESTSSGYSQPVDGLIYELLEDAKNESNEEFEEFENRSDPIEAGFYYVDGELNIDEDMTVDIGDGDVTLVVEGDVVGSGDVSVENPNDSAFRVYSAGDVFDIGGAWCTEACDSNDSHYIQVYGVSTMAIDFGPGDPQGAHYEGLIYAPSDEDHGWEQEGSCDGYQFAIQGGEDYVYGSVVTFSACAQGEGDKGVDYDDGLDEADFEGVPDGVDMPPELTYLNVVEYELTIETR